jgi:hypothetical protein
VSERAAQPAHLTIKAQIEALERDGALLDEDSFRVRAEAIDLIDLHVIDRIRYLLEGPNHDQELPALHRQAVALRQRLEALNERLFARLRHEIRTGARPGESLRRHLARYVEPPPGTRMRFGPTYDLLDEFVNGLLGISAAPEETLPREPEMVYYQQTPIRIILDLVERVRMGECDLFYDIGSGLGQVSIVVSLLTGVRCIGVDFEPAFCEYARRRAKSLNVWNAEFVNLDAREASLAGGTIYYLYTPFQGAMLKRFLQRLQHEARQRPITVCTYGPCSHDVAEERWLRHVGQAPVSTYDLAVFKST